MRDLWWTKLHRYRFSPSTSVFPCQCHSTKAPYSFSSTCCYYQNSERAKLGHLRKACYLENQGALAGKVLSLLLVSKALIVTAVETAHVIYSHFGASTLVGEYPVALRCGRFVRLRVPSVCGPSSPSGCNGGEEEYLVPGIEPRS
jgi:hypothetical protein